MSQHNRQAEIHRKTKETDVTVAVGLDGTGKGARLTGVGFLDHMLDLLARHGRLDLDARVDGDLETGSHHTVEDTGICLGQALDAALGDRRGIARYGHAAVPMDEALATARKNSSVSSWSNMPVAPGGSDPSKTSSGRPEKSSAQDARASSIGTTAWP